MVIPTPASLSNIPSSFSSGEATFFLFPLTIVAQGLHTYLYCFPFKNG